MLTTTLDISPNVIPLDTNGVVDAEGVSITDSDFMSHALNNTGKSDAVKLNIQRGNIPVNEYARRDAVTNELSKGTTEDPNHILGCYPVLFPYGEGGLETNRPIKVSYEAHVRWCLEYHDKRFVVH